MSLANFLATGTDIVQVQLTQVQGSSPRAAGTKMFVSRDRLFGTIGGGQLEYMAIDKARVMLKTDRHALDMDVPLGPEIGQCCGGRVQVALHRMTEKACVRACADETNERAQFPNVFIFGAGHVGRALSNVFQHMPVHSTLVDSRPEELAQCHAMVRTRLSAMAEAEIRRAPAGSAFLVLTHDHALDFLLTSEALERRDAAYVGMIGSATKRVKFERFQGAQTPPKTANRLTCPIGPSQSKDKRPEVIAISVAAEVMACLTSPADRKSTPVHAHKNSCVQKTPAKKRGAAISNRGTQNVRHHL